MFINGLNDDDFEYMLRTFTLAVASATVELALQRGDDPIEDCLPKIEAWCAILEKGRQLSPQQSDVYLRYVKLLQSEIRETHANWNETVKWAAKVVGSSES